MCGFPVAQQCNIMATGDHLGKCSLQGDSMPYLSFWDMFLDRSFLALFSCRGLRFYPSLSCIQPPARTNVMQAFTLSESLKAAKGLKVIRVYHVYHCLFIYLCICYLQLLCLYMYTSTFNCTSP